MRGEWAEFNPWQVPMGSIVEPALKLCNVHTYRVEHPQDVAETAAAAMDIAFSGDLAVAVILSQKLIGKKVWVK
jgi:sulfopyruvate decarboxylase TPP-binding subunit